VSLTPESLEVLRKIAGEFGGWAVVALAGAALEAFRRRLKRRKEERESRRRLERGLIRCAELQRKNLEYTRRLTYWVRYEFKRHGMSPQAEEGLQSLQRDVHEQREAGRVAEKLRQAREIANATKQPFNESDAGVTSDDVLKDIAG